MDEHFAAYRIPEFCTAHRISRSTFYNLLKVGKAPRTMQVGGCVLISKEAAAEWRRQCEQPQSREAGQAA